MNKPRLINANELKKESEKCLELLQKYKHYTAEDAMKHFLLLIDEQPTAYDTDKIVEQLGKCVNEEIYLWASDEDDYDEAGKLIVRKITDLHKYGSECFAKAIEIVKGDGLDE